MVIWPVNYCIGLSLEFSPNALGQPTQVGSYATGVSYYPNGAIQQFTYGNGIVHTMTQNARQLPARSTDCTLAGHLRGGQSAPRPGLYLRRQRQRQCDHRLHDCGAPDTGDDL